MPGSSKVVSEPAILDQSGPPHLLHEVRKDLLKPGLAPRKVAKVPCATSLATKHDLRAVHADRLQQGQQVVHRRARRGACSLGGLLRWLLVATLCERIVVGVVGWVRVERLAEEAERGVSMSAAAGGWPRSA